MVSIEVFAVSCILVESSVSLFTRLPIDYPVYRSLASNVLKCRCYCCRPHKYVSNVVILQKISTIVFSFSFSRIIAVVILWIPFFAYSLLGYEMLPFLSLFTSSLISLSLFLHNNRRSACRCYVVSVSSVIQLLSKKGLLKRTKWCLLVCC
jgi:hypothetical protein